MQVSLHSDLDEEVNIFGEDSIYIYIYIYMNMCLILNGYRDRAV